jgi:dolichol-phosphate mannosyltransferase
MTLTPTMPGINVDEPAPTQDAVVIDLTDGAGQLGTAHVVRRRRYFANRYDINGLVRIGSEIPLKELEFFRAPSLGRDFDIEIRRGSVGEGLRRRTALTRCDTTGGIRYEEHLGRRGANFSIEVSEPILIEVGPLLARSPHVLYTNVVEALLRFLMISKGRMLLHSACVEIDGHGVLLSARTDTGKTGTILRLLRERGARFLSDDMTILEPDGTAHAYPKPLTISAHTLRAVHAEELTKREWQRLRLQSQLHSKEGRQFGLMLAEMNLPIMGVNSLLQILIPPPKYAVDRLVPCDIVRSVSVDHLFLIERGRPAHEQLDLDATVPQLIANTDDAYGFPPFSQLAPALVVDGVDYLNLRQRESQLLHSALRNTTLARLASDDFSWWQTIPALVGAVIDDDDMTLSAAV